MYTEQSNSIFYYNDYRIVLLLDFSQSTTGVYPSQKSSYIFKMRQSIEAILKNLVFQLENKIKDQKTKKNDSQVRRPFGSF
jgi:hypothetical protein